MSPAYWLFMMMYFISMLMMLIMLFFFIDMKSKMSLTLTKVNGSIY